MYYENNRKIFEEGDKVRTNRGTIETVWDADEVQVITKESMRDNTWWHPSKLTLAYQPKHYIDRNAISAFGKGRTR